MAPPVTVALRDAGSAWLLADGGEYDYLREFRPITKRYFYKQRLVISVPDRQTSPPVLRYNRLSTHHLCPLNISGIAGNHIRK